MSLARDVFSQDQTPWPVTTTTIPTHATIGTIRDTENNHNVLALYIYLWLIMLSFTKTNTYIFTLPFPCVVLYSVY